MKTAIINLTGISPYSQGKAYEAEKLPRELASDYETRTWRERLHYDDSGEVYIPAMALKNCLSEAAKFLGIQIPGKGKSTYTKHFEAGVMVLESLMLGIHKDDVDHQRLFVPSDGVRGSGKRVYKCFPLIRDWTASATIYILDEIITRDVLERHLKDAGQFIGMGVFRPRNNGFYGRFKAEITSFEETVI